MSAAHPGGLEGVAYLHGAAPCHLAGHPPAPAATGPCTPALRSGSGAPGAEPPAAAADWAQRRHGIPEDPAPGKHMWLTSGAVLHVLLALCPDAGAAVMRCAFGWCSGMLPKPCFQTLTHMLPDVVLVACMASRLLLQTGEALFCRRQPTVVSLETESVHISSHR